MAVLEAAKKALNRSRAFLAKVGTGFAAKNATDKESCIFSKSGKVFCALPPIGYLSAGFGPKCGKTKIRAFWHLVPSK